MKKKIDGQSEVLKRSMQKVRVTPMKCRPTTTIGEPSWKALKNGNESLHIFPSINGTQGSPIPGHFVYGHRLIYGSF